MANLIIKPNSASGDKLIIQDRDGGAVLTTADSGATVSANTISNVSELKMAGLGSAPGSPSNGDIYYDTTTKSTKIYNGNHWVSIGGGTSASGGSITMCGGNNGVNYRVHRFFTSGNFVVTGGSITADILLVGGGGAGGARHAGGGGAGGVLHKTGATIVAGTYALVVGAGGTCPYNNNGKGTNGADTTGFGATAKGGGAGGAYNSGEYTGVAGGSGGGGGGVDNTASGGSSGNSLGSAQMAGGTAYGNGGQYGWYPGGGGDNDDGQGHHGGGGGGAGAHGGIYGGAGSPSYADESLRSTSSAVISGGVGIRIDIDGNNYYWAGGGGAGGGHSLEAKANSASSGGMGGINPGGDSLGRDKAGDGGPNTGGGGGGGGQVVVNSRGGYGGSGIAIIRYII